MVSTNLEGSYDGVDTYCGNYGLHTKDCSMLALCNSKHEISGRRINVEKKQSCQKWCIERQWDNFLPRSRSALDN